MLVRSTRALPVDFHEEDLWAGSTKLTELQQPRWSVRGRQCEQCAQQASWRLVALAQTATFGNKALQEWHHLA